MTELVEKESSNQNPTSDVEAKLVELAVNSLGVSSIGVREDFFVLGGTLQQAEKFISSVNEVFELKLDLDDFTECLTVSAISKIAEKNKAKLNSRVIPLNKTDGKPPLFLVCGIILYGQLSKNLIDSYSCYGIYVPEEDAFLQNQNSISGITVEEIAQCYVKAILGHTPEGVYTIAGVSFGGVLAFEISRQLKALGKTVNSLIILDTVLPGSIKRDMFISRKLFLSKVKRALKNRIYRIAGKIFDRKLRKKKVTDVEGRGLRLLSTLRGKKATAYFKGRPVFAGSTLIVRASEQGDFKLAPDLAWGDKLQGPIILVEASGSHLSILANKETADFIKIYAPPI